MVQYLEAFRGFLPLGGSGIHKTIRMGPDPLQGLDRPIKGAKESGAGAYLNDSFL